MAAGGFHGDREAGHALYSWLVGGREDLKRIGTGTTVVTASAVAAVVLSFVGWPRIVAMLLVLVLAVAIVGGSVFEVVLRHAWAERNRRHRSWLASHSDVEMLDFRAQVLRRELAVEQAHQDWSRPLVAAVAVALSAVVLPYSMLMPLVPDALVSRVSDLWTPLVLVVAAGYAGAALVAMVRQQRADHSDAAGERPRIPA